MLVIDQFEELFTLTETEQERQQFLTLLAMAATEEPGPVIVVLTLRADLYHRCMAYPRFYRLLEAHQTSALPMSATELRAAIRGPAALPDVQVAFEGNLVSELVFEVQEQPGTLPLLQFTLEQLFLQRQGRLLTLQAYRAMGGVRGALARHAETVYQGLPSEQHRLLARHLFLRLIDPGLTARDSSRRRASLSELLLPDAQQTALLQATAEAFIAARLLTTDEIMGTTTIDISHEALIGAWTRLANWLNEARDDLRLQLAVSSKAAEWEQRGQPDDLLLRGAVLNEAEQLAQRQTASAREIAFLQASASKQKALLETELVRQRRALQLQRQASNRLRGLAAVLSVFLVVAVVLSSVAFFNWQQAQLQAQRALLQTQTANSRELVIQARLALLHDNKEEALLLALKAYQTASNADTRNTLLSVLLASPHLAEVLHEGNYVPSQDLDENHKSRLLFEADGQTLINARLQGQISIWNLAKKAVHYLDTGTIPFDSHRRISDLALSPDGRTLAVVGDDFFTSQGFIEIWDLAAEKKVSSLSFPDTSLDGMAFSPDGKKLAFLESPTTGTAESIWISLFDLSLGKVTSSSQPFQGTSMALAFNAAGTRVEVATCISGPSYYCAKEQVLQWDSATNTFLHPLFSTSPGSAATIAISPNGRYIAFGGADGSVQLWDTAIGQAISSPTIEHTGAVDSLAFSPDSALPPRTKW